MRHTSRKTLSLSCCAHSAAPPGPGITGGCCCCYFTCRPIPEILARSRPLHPFSGSLRNSKWDDFSSLPWVQSRGIGFSSLFWSWWSSCVMWFLCFFFLCCLQPPCLWQLQPAAGSPFPHCAHLHLSIFIFVIGNCTHSGTHTTRARTLESVPGQI